MKLRKIQWWRESNQRRLVCSTSVVAARTTMAPWSTRNFLSNPALPKALRNGWVKWLLILNHRIFSLTMYEKCMWYNQQWWAVVRNSDNEEHCTSFSPLHSAEISYHRLNVESSFTFFHHINEPFHWFQLIN